MTKVILLGLVLVLRASFLLFEVNDNRYYTFPVTGRIIYIQSFVWFLSEFITISVISFLNIFRDRSWGITMKFFAAVTILDLADFLLTSNTVWWYWGKLPVCMNTVAILIFISGLIYETWKTRMRLTAS